MVHASWAEIDAKPPRYYVPRRFNVVAMCFMCATIAYMMRANLSIAIVEMSKQLHWPESQKGLFLSAFFWGYITTQLLGGMAARKFGPKYTMMFVIVAPSVFTIIIPFIAAKSSAALIACRVLIGVASGATFPSLYLMLGRWTPIPERSLSLSFVAAGSNIGTVIIDTIGPIIIDQIGWQYVFFISGSIGFVWLLYFAITVTNSPGEMKNIHPSETKYIAASIGNKPAPTETTKILDASSHKVVNAGEDDESRPLISATAFTVKAHGKGKGSDSSVEEGHGVVAEMSNWDALKVLVTKASFWVIVFNGLCTNWGFYIFLTWLPTYVHSELGFDLQVSGIIAITPSISSALTGFFAGGVADRMISRGWRLLYVRKFFFFLGCMCYIVTLVLLAFYRQIHLTPAAAAVMLAIGTCGGGFHVPGYSANIFDIAPNHPSIVVGVANTAATIPGIVGVYSTGILLQHGASWGTIWLITAGFYMAALVSNMIFSDVKRVV